MNPAAVVFRSVVRPVHLRVRSIHTMRFDQRLGITTAERVVAEHLGHEPDCTNRPLGYSALGRLRRRWNLGRDDVLLDLGCGSGRVIAYFATTPIRRVIGVEYEPTIAELARRNLASLQGRKAHGVIEAVDATTYPIPDDVTALFLYNPFGPDVLEPVLRALRDSVQRAPRRVQIAYANPVHSDLVAQYARRVGRFHVGWRPGEDWLRSQRVELFELP